MRIEGDGVFVELRLRRQEASGCLNNAWVELQDPEAAVTCGKGSI